LVKVKFKVEVEIKLEELSVYWVNRVTCVSWVNQEKRLKKKEKVVYEAKFKIKVKI